MSGFTGMVVAPGSPHDCLVLSSKTPYQRVANPMKEMKVTKRSLTAKPVSTTVTTSVFIWAPFEMPDRRGATIGFWVPEGRDASWLIETLAVTYQKGARK